MRTLLTTYLLTTYLLTTILLTYLLAYYLLAYHLLAYLPTYSPTYLLRQGFTGEDRQLETVAARLKEEQQLEPYKP